MPTLDQHPAVTDHGSGVYSSDLADFVRALGEAAASRIEGIGNEQYSDGEGKPQKFETMSVDHMYNELLDELADVFAYLSMITIKILNTRKHGSIA